MTPLERRLHPIEITANGRDCRIDIYFINDGMPVNGVEMRNANAPDTYQEREVLTQ